jgi:hypothetical protein
MRILFINTHFGPEWVEAIYEFDGVRQFKQAILDGMFELYDHPRFVWKVEEPIYLG